MWYINICLCVLSHVQFFVTPWTVACWVALSMEFPGKNTGVGCHFLLQRIFLTQGSNPCLLCLLHWQVDSLASHRLGIPVIYIIYIHTHIQWNISHTNEIIPFAAIWIDQDIIILTEVRRKTNNTYMWNLIFNKIQMNLFTNYKQT